MSINKSLLEAAISVLQSKQITEISEDIMTAEEIESLLDDTASECEEAGGEVKLTWDAVADYLAKGDLKSASKEAEQLMDQLRGGDDFFDDIEEAVTVGEDAINSFLNSVHETCNEVGGEALSLYNTAEQCLEQSDIEGAEQVVASLKNVLHMDEACEKSVNEDWVALSSVSPDQVAKVKTKRSGDKYLMVIDVSDDGTLFYCVTPKNFNNNHDHPIEIADEDITAISTDTLDEGIWDTVKSVAAGAKSGFDIQSTVGKIKQLKQNQAKIFQQLGAEFDSLPKELKSQVTQAVGYNQMKLFNLMFKTNSSVSEGVIDNIKGAVSGATSAFKVQRLTSKIKQVLQQAASQVAALGMTGQKSIDVTKKLDPETATWAKQVITFIQNFTKDGKLVEASMEPEDEDSVVGRLVLDMGFDSAEERKRDSLDFKDISVMSAKDALKRAYVAGWNARAHHKGEIDESIISEGSEDAPKTRATIELALANTGLTDIDLSEPFDNHWVKVGGQNRITIGMQDSEETQAESYIITNILLQLKNGVVYGDFSGTPEHEGLSFEDVDDYFSGSPRMESVELSEAAALAQLERIAKNTLGTGFEPGDKEVIISADNLKAAVINAFRVGGKSVTEGADAGVFDKIKTMFGSDFGARFITTPNKIKAALIAAAQEGAKVAKA